MQRYIILCDTDIGWSEKLERELAKFDIGIRELDHWELETIPKEKNGKVMKEWWSRLVFRSQKAFVIVISMEQLSEWMDGLKEWRSDNKLQTDSDRRESPADWNDMLREICRRSVCPVVLITNQAGEEQEYAAFEAGVFDYIERDKAMPICVKRILLCGRKGNKGLDVRKSTFSVAEDKHCLLYSGREIPLTDKEYQVFSLLWKKKGELVTKEVIFSGVWANEGRRCSRVVDTIVKQLRVKLEETPYGIRTRYKMGYYLYESEES